MTKHLVSTISGERYPFGQLAEHAENGESLEVEFSGLPTAAIREGQTVWERFADFLPFDNWDPAWSLGEGDTPLLLSPALGQYVGIDSLWLKNETTNPTWSFKDRGSLACILMAKAMGEPVTATVSTGNMGSSIAAYGARAGVRPIVFIPPTCPEEKIRPMALHGATIIKIDSPDYGAIKTAVLALGEKLGMRTVSGNNPIRIEGYKFTAFELYEQLHGAVPDFIAVPTSACGNLRGIFKGYRELREARLINRLPRMIVVQAATNSPLVTAWREGRPTPVPFSGFETLADAITSGNPSGGDEILQKAYAHRWLAESVSEAEILAGQRRMAEAGFFVEPASATSLVAIQKLRASGRIKGTDSVVAILTGSGLKSSAAFHHHKFEVITTGENGLERTISDAMQFRAFQNTF